MKCKAENCEIKTVRANYCGKHRRQLKKHGRIHRSIYEPNEIIKYEDYAEVCLYDRDSIEIERTIIDLEDIKYIQKYKWILNNMGRVRTSSGLLLHHLILNAVKYQTVHYKDNNTLNNRRSNLMSYRHIY